MTNHGIPLSIAADLLEQADKRALRSLDQAELARLRSVLQRTLSAVDARMAQTRIDEILDLLPTLSWSKAQP